MSSVNNPIKAGGVADSPLLIYQPFNIIVFLSFYSPIILAMCMIYLSFVSQNFKGFIYLGFLIGVCVVRNFVYMLNGSKTNANDGTICTSVQYSAYGNPTFSAFVFAFTIMYLSLPMFSNGAPNFWVFFGLLVYFFIDLFIKIYKKCTIQTTDLILNILMGLTSSAIIVVLMYAGGSGKYMFFNEVSSNKEMCSQPKTQTFRCDMYKDGELVGGI